MSKKTENADSDLKVHALHYANEPLVCVRLSSPFKNFYKLAINHISICFFTTVSKSKKMFFFRAGAEKGMHCLAHWREQRGMDSCSNVSMLCYKTNGTIACTIEFWMHFKGLLSTQAIVSCYSYASFVLRNLPRASITQDVLAKKSLVTRPWQKHCHASGSLK